MRAMNFRAAWNGLFSPVTLQDKPLAEPQPFYRERPMTGFWNTLTDEQKKRVLSNENDPHFGDPAFCKRA